MKTFALIVTSLAGAASFPCFSQNGSRLQSSVDMGNGEYEIVSYHVEERVNMNFGGSITTYDVPSLSLISTKELGENNTRTVTPKYGKVRARIAAIENIASLSPVTLTVPAPANVTTLNTSLIAGSERKREFASIDVVGTYERVMDKGYKSVAMITKVADRHFFDGDMSLAAKWYTELFSSTTDLETVYYYRYAQSLIETGQKEKGDEMMKIFESKSL